MVLIDISSRKEGRLFPNIPLTPYFLLVPRVTSLTILEITVVHGAGNTVEDLNSSVEAGNEEERNGIHSSF